LFSPESERPGKAVLHPEANPEFTKAELEKKQTDVNENGRTGHQSLGLSWYTCPVVFCPSIVFRKRILTVRATLVVAHSWQGRHKASPYPKLLS
jgi:hypothetical protein